MACAATRPARAASATAFAAVLLIAAMGTVGTMGLGGHAEAATANSKAASAPLRVALVADIPQWPAAEGATTRLLEQLREQQIAFVVHAGGIKGDTESCSDALLSDRLRLLDQSPLPVIYVPGEAEWAECNQEATGKFDPVERLTRLREMFFQNDTSLGQRKQPLMRQSDQSLFRSYRENVRWTARDVVFVGLNVPGDNNHYRAEGGRNSEFEDRREANRQWLARAFSVAHQEDAGGIVIVVHGDPRFGNGWEDQDGPSLLTGFLRRGKRDGFLEFKRQLRDLSAKFHGQVLLVHTSVEGFGIDTPLRTANGKVVRNVTRVTLPNEATRQWAELTISPGSQSIFSVRLRDGPPETRD